MPFLTQGPEGEPSAPYGAGQTNWKFIGIVVVLAVIVGTGILWCQKTSEQSYLLLETNEPERVTEDETADWRTYRNEEYGFEVKYPEDFEEYGYEKKSDSFSAQSKKTRYSIYINIVTGKSSFQGYLLEIEDIRAKAYEGGPSVTVLRKQEMNILDKPAMHQEIQSLAASLPGIETFIDITPKMIISISVRGGDWDSSFESLRELNSQILSTFRFIEAQKGIIDWKACSVDDDCMVFDKAEDCMCGCFNKNYTGWKPVGGECFCPVSPISCKCIDGRCEEVLKEDETGWQTYRNEEYGFEIKLPLDSEYEEEGQIKKDSWSLLSFLVFTPAENSLDNYLGFSLDKSGKDIIEKSKKYFGDVKEGVFYTAQLLPNNCLEKGFIFNNGGFTYHFWADNCHARADMDLFLNSLSTIKFIDSTSQISVSETQEVRIYKNENPEIEFGYPKEWGSLAFLSVKNDVIGNKVYLFTVSGESISILYYHENSGTLAFIEKGDKYDGFDGGKRRQDILHIYKDKTIKTIYSLPPNFVTWYGKIADINISPNGKYVYFVLYGYEYHDCMMFNIETGLDITSSDNIRYNPYKNVYWSSNNKWLAIKSYLDEFGGEGTYGIFVSDYDNPEKLNKIFAPDYWKEVTSSPGLHISDLYFIEDDRLFFAVDLRKWNLEKKDYDILKTTEYEYIIKTKELKEIE